MSITSSQAQNITSPNGNSLAVFIDGVTGVMMLKDINGRTAPLSNYVCGGGGGGTSPFEYGTAGGGTSSIQPVLGSNYAIGENDTVSGGGFNVASGGQSTVSGGLSNNAYGEGSVVGGGRCNVASSNSATVSGGFVNTASSVYATIAGGRGNGVSSDFATIGGGKFNTASGNSSTVGGGHCNIASNVCSTVSGGSTNTASGINSTVSGGFSNIASGACSFIGGGVCNLTGADFSSILGGCLNKTCGFASAMIIGSNLCATQKCTTFMNCASVDNLTAGCIVRVGTNKVLENSVSKIGSFFSTVTQCATTINTPKAMTLSNTDSFSSGISVVSNSQITVDTAGIYNLQFSAQIDRVTTSGVDKIEIWLRKQGVDIPNSTTKVTVSGTANQAKVVASWNFYLSLTAGQYVELMYSVTDLQVQLVAEVENLVVPYPATPSLIVTIQKIN